LVSVASRAQADFTALDEALKKHIDQKDVAGIEALVFQNGKET
jgi:hypothetical protein